MQESWTRLSVRQGKAVPDGPYEGVPAHLRHAASEWLRVRFGWHRSEGMRHSFMANVANGLRIPVQSSHEIGGISNQILRAVEQDEDLYLDCIDLVLHLERGRGAGSLPAVLTTGGSAWRVNEAGTGLERRVDANATAAFKLSIAASDAASLELQEAWTAAYGRNPNPSDAWDHAIKAVEELTIPLVIPKKDKANLGGVAGEFNANPASWSFGLPVNGGHTNGNLLESLIRHLWPNPDRHGGSGKRAPTQNESEAAVQIAVTIVNLCRGRLERSKP